MPSQSETESAETADTNEIAGDTTDIAVATADPTSETVGAGSPAAAEGAVEAASPAAEDGADQPAPGQVSSFLREIARAMQAAVDRERGRITAETTNTLEAHVHKVRVRASSEAADLKRLAKQDVEEIRAWSAAEAERLRLETESRVAARREDLGRHLRQHDALVEHEISGASEAFDEYRAELDRFVSRVADQREPSEIARLVELLPEPPHVEDVAAAARAHAFAQLSRSEAADADARPADAVGVMDPGIVTQPAGPEGQDGDPASGATGTSEDDPVGAARPRRRLGRTPVDLQIPLGLVVFLAVLAVVMIVVLTGQARPA